MTRPRFLPDNFTLTLIATVILASLLPASGQTAVAFGWVTNLAIALLFFLHGAKLSRKAIVAGAGHWRLHLLVFSLTFVLFPLLGLALKPVLSPLIGNELYMGMLYLCALLYLPGPRQYPGGHLQRGGVQPVRHLPDAAAGSAAAQRAWGWRLHSRCDCQNQRAVVAALHRRASRQPLDRWLGRA